MYVLCIFSTNLTLGIRTKDLHSIVRSSCFDWMPPTQNHGPPVAPQTESPKTATGKSYYKTSPVDWPRKVARLQILPTVRRLLAHQTWPTSRSALCCEFTCHVTWRHHIKDCRCTVQHAFAWTHATQTKMQTIHRQSVRHVRYAVCRRYLANEDENDSFSANSLDGATTVAIRPLFESNQSKSIIDSSHNDSP